MSDLVGNPENRFSRVAAHFTAVIVFFSYFGPQHKSFVLLNRLSMSNEYPQTMLWSINEENYITLDYKGYALQNDRWICIKV